MAGPVYIDQFEPQNMNELEYILNNFVDFFEAADLVKNRYILVLEIRPRKEASNVGSNLSKTG